MNQTYKRFFGFAKDPFTSDIDLDDILITEDIKAVYERFQYNIQLGAVAVITGEVGSGKSTALRWTINKLHPSEHKVLWITANSGSILEFYRQMLAELELEKTSNSKAVNTRMIKGRVFELIKEKRQKPVIVVDEASLMRLEVFAELHTICQFECDSKPWLPIVLVGQNHLLDKLQYRGSAPLASRIVARSHLNSSTRQEMETYLLHHLRVAGVQTELFSEKSITAIHQGSGGILRKANHLARGSLIAASKEKSQRVNPEHVQIASSEIL